MLVIKWLALPPDVLLVGGLLCGFVLMLIMVAVWQMCRMAARG